MKKYEIVKDKRDFDTIIHQGTYQKGAYCILYSKNSSYPYPRLGIAVGTKVGNAVTRNHLKRQVRMIFTQNKKLFKNNTDYIIIMKRSSLDLLYCELEKEVLKLI